MLKLNNLLVLCLLGCVCLTTPAIAAKKLSHLYAVSPTDPAVDPAYVKAYARKYFRDIPIMIAIIECESGFRQYEADGRLLVNPEKGSSASGATQILYTLHKADWSNNPATNITTLEGNFAFARKLFMDAGGPSPWNASKPCWKNKVHKYEERVANNAATS